MNAKRFDQIKACVFDAYGTLFDVSSAARRCSDALGGEAGRLADLWRAKQLEYAWTLALSERYDDFWQVTAAALDHGLDTLGIDDPALRARLMECYLWLDAYPDAADCLAALRQRPLKLAILSNGTAPMVISSVKNAGLGEAFGMILSVAEAGIYKPAPAAYQVAPDRLRLPAESILYVSSNGWDLHGATSFGFRTVWVNRKGGPAERLPCAPDATVASLGDIPALVAE